MSSPDLPPSSRSPVPFETSTRSKSLDQQQLQATEDLPVLPTCKGYDKRVFPLNDADLKELNRSSDEAASALAREDSLRSSQMSSRFNDSNTAPKYDKHNSSSGGSGNTTPFMRQRTLSHISIPEDRFSDSSSSSQKRQAHRTTSSSSSVVRRSLSSTTTSQSLGRRRKKSSHHQKDSDIYSYSDDWNSDQEETEEEEDYNSDASTSNDESSSNHHQRKKYTDHQVYKTEKQRRRSSKRRRSSNSESRDHKKPLVLKIKKS